MSENTNSVNVTTEPVKSAAERAPRAPRAPRKKKKNQIPIGILVLLVVIGVAVWLSQKSGTLSMFWIFGCSFGYVLQRSRFCFTAAFRDPCITGSTTVTKAVLIAFAITTVGFTAIKYGSFVTTGNIPGQSYIMPISLALIVGGILFGIGMVIAGGCASGTLMRVGEGFTMQALSLLFFVIGSLIGAFNMGWWEINFIATAPKVFLPDIFGWLGAVVLQLAIIGLLYIAVDKFEEKKMGY